MNNYITLVRNSKIVCLVGTIVLTFFLSACEQKETDLGKEVLIRVADRVMTVLEFKNAFEIAKIAYEDSVKEQPEELRKAQVRLLNQLTIEMMLLERAEELEISVTETELEKAIAEIKSDYPAGEFEKTLLEFAVSYDSWKVRLRNRLILDKVIEEELKNPITITPEDVSEFYRENIQGREKKPEADQSSEDINEAIVNQLRRQKAEEAYNSWIESLKGQYELEINSDQWEKLTGSTSIEEQESTLGDVSKSE